MSANPSSASAGAVSRRRFLKNSAAALAGGALVSPLLSAFPQLAPASALGRDGTVAPSNRVAIGVLGMQQGWDSFRNCLSFKDVEGVALCDVDAQRLERRLQETRSRANGRSAKGWRDFREMFAKAGLDGVILAAPDHWHGVMCVAAARAGIDIYGEKPLAHTLREGRAIVDAVRRHGRVWQTGMWQRSTGNFTRAVQLVRSGRIGKVKRVHVGTGGDFGNPSGVPRYADVTRGAAVDRGTIGKPPAHLDYEMWVGPAPWFDYDPRVTHYHWRWVLNFGGGNLLDWVSHHVDIALWGLDFDRTAPVKVTGSANFATNPPWDAPRTYNYELNYADGTVVTVDSTMGAKWFGENGQWIFVNRGQLTASDKSILAYNPPAEAVAGVYVSRNHWRNWIDCIKTRRETITPAETAHNTATAGHLGLTAAITGRTIRWDAATETIPDDPAADALLTPTIRAPWSL
ncbi:MAG: Gfo/Idh/MocA family oxidoreductase [Puniceicoccales bacterium]|jgi:predicted dehydrogenase|nr:Gfo/Idh/MocA family oxidoreductase [Puniceicoccales bacterium]